MSRFVGGQAPAGYTGSGPVNRPKAAQQNRQTTVVEYRITIRYKSEGQKVEKVIMLLARQHDRRRVQPSRGTECRENLLGSPGQLLRMSRPGTLV